MTDNLRVVFFGNSESIFSNRHFEALCGTHCRIAAVVDVPPARRVSTNTRTSDSTSNFVEKARAQGIPAFEPVTCNAPEFVSTLRALQPDLFVAVGYMGLLKSELLAVPQLFAANFHASLLPAYRGKHPVFWALRDGVKWAGLTVHVMDANLDTGDLLYQVRVRTRKRDTVSTLYDRIMAASLPLIERLITDAQAGSWTRTPQTNAGASYFSSAQESDFQIEWSRDAEQLRRRIQASPGQCFAEVAGQRIFFMDAECAANPGQDCPGSVIKIGRVGITIAAGKGALYVKRVRLADGIEKPAAMVFRRT